MTTSTMFRKILLTVHVTVSVGWLGAAAAYLVVAIAAITSADEAQARASYLTLERLAWLLILPCSLSALTSGLVQSLVTPWGLLRHRWVVFKLALTLAATAVLLGHLPAIERVAAIAVQSAGNLREFGKAPYQLALHAAGGVVVLGAITAVSVFKPWGLTAYGRRSNSRMTGTGL